MIKTNVFILILLSIFLVIGCNNGETTGTSGGNPIIISVESKPYTNDGSAVKSARLVRGDTMPLSTKRSSVITSFQFCITKLKVKLSGEGALGASQEAKLGLIDLSNQNETVNWGDIELSDNSTITELYFEVHRDPELCLGEDFSVKYNSASITKDLEFKFRFSPPIVIDRGGILTLGVDQIAKSIEDAHQAGDFNNSNIGPYIENTFGDGSF